MTIIVRPNADTPVAPSFEIRVIQAGKQPITVVTGITDVNAGLTLMMDWLNICRQPGDRVELVATQKECFEVIGTLVRKIEQQKGYRAYAKEAQIIPIRSQIKQ